MRIEYICHACLLIDTGDAKIVTDPWFDGPAYSGQWHIFPKPVHLEGLQSADFILISHGHEDHLHENSLKRLPKNAKVFYPYNWYKGTREYIESFGFSDVKEISNFQKYQLTPRTSVTFVTVLLDSIMVIESDGKVLVDINDALHALHPNVIEIFIRALRKRWPKIDAVFCGFGGASYFPNTLHIDGKDDEEVGILREQLFVHNFCRIIEGLQPKIAVPFAADFVVLDPENRWINRARFPREQIADYYQKHFSQNGEASAIHPMYPGDVLEDANLQPASPYREQISRSSVDDLIESQYKTEIQRKKEQRFITDEDAEILGEQILKQLNTRAPLFPPERLRELRFTIQVKDITENNQFHVRFQNQKAVLTRSHEDLKEAMLVIETRSDVLRYSFDSDWGGDVITIGYGCNFRIFDLKVIEQQLDSLCIQLLTNHPSAQRYMKRNPLRATKFLAGNPQVVKWIAKRLRAGRGMSMYNQTLWLSRTKCEICQVCDMPLLDDAFSGQLSPD